MSFYYKRLYFLYWEINQKYQWRKNATLVNISIATYLPVFLFSSLLLYFAPRNASLFYDIYMYFNVLGFCISLVLNNRYLYHKNYHHKIIVEYSKKTKRRNFYLQYLIAIGIGVFALALVFGSIFYVRYLKFGTLDKIE